MLTWVDGELCGEEAAKVSAFDRGLTIGEGVFETVKVVDGVPFALGRHIARLRRSAAALGLGAPDEARVREACAAVVGQLGALSADVRLATGQSEERRPGQGRRRLGLHRLRITATGGAAPLGLVRGEAMPTLIVAMSAIPETSAATSVALVPWARNERSPVVGLKTTSYVENVRMLDWARSCGAAEAVMANTRARLCEGAGSNVFVVVDDQVLTPSRASGCLPGVTRELVLEWTDAREADLDVGVLDQAEEIFLTSSLRSVQPVDAVIYDDRRRDLPAPGPVTDRIMGVFADRSQLNPEP